jgi:transmembrane sensor
VKSVREEAARWFARLHHAGPDHPDRGRFEAWLGASPANAAEYAAIADVWEDFDSPARLGDLAGAVERDHATSALERKQQRRKLLKRGLLGVLLLAGTGAMAWQGWQLWLDVPLTRLTARTGTGEIGRQDLPDGSRIVLGAGSEVDVVYFRNRRTVTLIKGDALFDVSRDPDRPFIVDGGIARATVLGTRFAVNRGIARVRVSVESGIVRVDDAAGRGSVVLDAGQVAEVEQGSGVQRLAVAAADGFAWQRGTLVFDNASLQEIAAGLSRYRRIPVRAPVEGEQRLTAVVQSTDIEGFLHTLPTVAPVAVEDSPGETLILPR